MTSTGLSTAGAVPVKNDKGDYSMEKVKVQRYVSGRVPQYAEGVYSSSEDDEDFILSNQIKPKKVVEDEEKLIEVFVNEEDVLKDRRLRRLQRRDVGLTDGPRERQRTLENEEYERHSDESDEDLNENLERRHAMILQRQRQAEEEEELLPSEEEIETDEGEEDEQEESEYEEYSESEEDIAPRLKPVFVRKKDRLTLQEKKMEELKIKDMELAEKRSEEERKKEALRIIEEENKREELEKEKKDEEMFNESMIAVDTDDENEEVAYESWKLRELRRLKRTKEEEEARVKEEQEIERIRKMTDEEREEEFKKNPKLLTNAAPKGKYKYLQKYYHRGAFYLDQEDEVYKRDFAQPTLEDHFDKTILPKIMQVKNFGRSGRTKYTHLVDQDTTAFDSPWTTENPQTSKFFSTRAGGAKPIFERPTKRRK